MSQTKAQLVDAVDGSIVAADLAADCVTTDKVANSAITDAKISGLTSSKLTGALPAISGAALTGISSAGKARNLVINGAMQVAQRGTSSTSNGYATVDRMSEGEGGLDETCTQSQITLGSSDVGPYAKGFRQAYRIQNGNQTSGAGATDFIRIEYRIEAQDIANSGWDYTNSSSNISLQFWVRSSVAQNFYFIVNSTDGTARSYPMETGSLSAGTWTKVTKTIPGDSSLQFDNDVNEGFTVFFYIYLGTNYANNSVSLNAWKNVGNPQTPTNTTTWFTTNDATWDITGFQIEVGDSATDFEHRSFGQELHLCKRYYHKTTSYNWFNLIEKGSTYRRLRYEFPNTMRVIPTVLNATGNNNGSSGTPTGTQHASTKKITFHWDSPGLVELASGCEFSAEIT
tara:strand:+ start:148 stop:1344 length:1197 start_codon:yes stop_codon:yes gene_type:complete